MPKVPPNQLPRGAELNPVAFPPSKDLLLMAAATMSSMGRLDAAAPAPQPVKQQKGLKVVK